MSSDVIQSSLGAIIAEGKAELQTGPFGTMLKAGEYSREGAPVVSVGEIREGYLEIGSKTPRVSDEIVRRMPRFLLMENDIVFGRKGSTHRNALIKKTEQGYFLGSDGIRLRVNSRSICPKFLSYQLRSASASNWLKANSEGTTMPSLNQDILSRFPIILLSTVDQKAIAHILGTLDDKIELNRKTNETLEAMAKALFKSWFVDFDPVRAKAEGRPTGLPTEISDLFPDSFEDSELGEIPSGWSVGEIDQILNLQKDSLDPASASEEIFDHYSIPAFDAGRFPAKELGSSIRSQKFLVGDRDLLVSKLNPSTPRVWIPFASSGRRAICSTEFLVCRTSSDFGRAYAYCLASSDAIVEAMTSLAGGTSNSHQRIRLGDFLALPCCIGTEMVRSAFSDVVEPLLNRSLMLRTESRSLSTTRDALLPKLISGEIRIPDAEKMLEEVVL